MKPSDIKQHLDQLLQQSPFAGLGNDMQQMLHARIQAMLLNMNLVTREEFDAQMAVLQRTQAKLSALEEKLQTLESSLHSATSESESHRHD